MLTMGATLIPFPLFTSSSSTNYQLGHRTSASKELAKALLCLNVAYTAIIIQWDSWDMTDSINSMWRWDTIVSLPTIKQENSWTIQM